MIRGRMMQRRQMMQRKRMMRRRRIIMRRRRIRWIRLMGRPRRLYPDACATLLNPYRCKGCC